MAFHNTLTSFLGVNATEYAPKHETSTEFMNAKFEEVLDNDKWLKENCMRIYKSLQEIDSDFDENTPVKDVILAMEDNSMAIYETSADSTGVYPTLLGTVIITKQNIDRNYVQCSNPDGDVWHTSYHVVSNPNCEWEKLLVVEDLQSRGVVETKAVLPQNADANTITANGVYQIWDSGTQEAVNFPIANPIGTLVVTNGGVFPVQTFTFYQGKMWTRSRGSGSDEWTAWERVTTQKTKVQITSSMMQNGWGSLGSFQNSYVVTGDTISLNFLLTQGATSDKVVIMKDLPRISEPVLLTANITRTMGSLVYETDGTIRLEGGQPSASWVAVNATIHI